MRKWFWSLFSLVFVLIGCPGEVENDSFDTGYRLHAEVIDEVILLDPVSEVYSEIQLADGVVLADYAALEEYLLNRLAENPEYGIRAYILETGGQTLPFDPDVVPLAPIYIGGYVITAGSNYGRVRGCVQRDGRYWAFRITRASGGADNVVADLHIMAYRDLAGRRCLGLYESRTLRSICMCNPTNQQIRNALTEVLAGIIAAGAIVWAAAQIMAPYAESLLLAI